MDRRAWLAAAAVLAAAGCGGVKLAAERSERVVQVHTKKFEFVPNEIALRRGEPVVLELIADDIEMGFRCKALELGAVVTPGKPVRVAFTPQKAGKFRFYCDVFCGDGHEDMDGEITVTG
jgi:cytochrome c oxidase subunit 2